MILEEDGAYMDKREFDGLLEYSTTMPTGTTIGKVWKREMPRGAKMPDWWLGEYYDIHSEISVGIRWRKIFIEPPPIARRLS